MSLGSLIRAIVRINPGAPAATPIDVAQMSDSALRQIVAFGDGQVQSRVSALTPFNDVFGIPRGHCAPVAAALTANVVTLLCDPNTNRTKLDLRALSANIDNVWVSQAPDMSVGQGWCLEPGLGWTPPESVNAWYAVSAQAAAVSVAEATWPPLTARFAYALSMVGNIVGANTLTSTFANPFTSPITVASWVHPLAGAGHNYAILGTATTPGPFWEIATNGDVRFFANSASAGYTFAGANVPFNADSHLAVRWDGATIDLFQNGVKTLSAAFVGSYPGSQGNLSLGSRNNGNSSFYGYLDETGMWTRALSDQLIQQLYWYGLIPGSPSVLYRYAEGSGSSTADRSGNGHTMSWSGSHVPSWTTAVPTLPVV